MFIFIFYSITLFIIYFSQVLERSFFPNEMTTIGTEIDNVNALDARSDLVELCKDVAKDNISLIALEKTSGQVVGFVFNKIQVSF